MGASPDNFSVIAEMHKLGLLGKGAAVADLGCQQPRGATEQDLSHFFGTFDVALPEGKLAKLAQDGVFIAEHLTAAGFRYRSFNIVEAPQCMHFDLNSDTVPLRWRSRFDLVLNFGTTEHALNQYNALRTLHDLAKPRGLLYSFFIRGSHMEHGLLHYSDRFVDMLCAANEYRTVWRNDDNRPGEQCTWIVMQKTSGKGFKPIIDVELGESLPQLVLPFAKSFVLSFKRLLRWT
jgi:hypothetical protein